MPGRFSPHTKRETSGTETRSADASQCPDSTPLVDRFPVPRESDDADAERPADHRVEHRRSVPIRDRDRHIPVAVLEQNHVAGAGIRERASRDGVVALAGELQLDAGAGHDADPIEVVARQVEGDVAEAVEVERRGVEDALGERRLRQLEPDERLRIDRGAELADRDAAGEMRRGRREQVAPVERPRDRLERVGRVRELVGLGDPGPFGRGQQQPVVRAT